MIRTRTLVLLLLLVGASKTNADAQRAPDPHELFRDGDRIVFIGNTFAERMSLFPHFEAELTARLPDRGLTFRNLGWSGDEITLMPRPLNFGDLHTHLAEQRADVIFAFFGMNESFAGLDGLTKFRSDLESFLSNLLSQRYNGTTAPRVVLVSPIAHERVARVPVDPAERNEVLASYVEAMREVAAGLDLYFLDLFAPTLPLAGGSAVGEFTINGIHPNDRGYWLLGRMMLEGLGVLEPGAAEASIDQLARCDAVPGAAGMRALAAMVREKNDLFFYRWRPVNGEYIYGRRKEPFGVVNFPGEMQQLETMIAEREREIRVAAGAAASKMSVRHECDSPRGGHATRVSR